MFKKELARACEASGAQVALANPAGGAGMVAGGMGLGGAPESPIGLQQQSEMAGPLLPDAK